MKSEIAICYLETLDDPRNKISLGEDQLTVVQKGNTHDFDLVQIKDIFFQQRKPMLYLIGGGIMVPFTALAFYRGFLDPLPTLILLIGGLFALYFGWIGYQVLTIQLFTHHRDFKLKAISSNLKAFVDFTLKRLPANSHLNLQKEQMIYHITTKKLWRARTNATHYQMPQEEDFIHASQFHQIKGTLHNYFKGQKELLLITIDPVKVNAEIKYEDLKDSGALFPHIYGPLNVDAVEKIAELP